MDEMRFYDMIQWVKRRKRPKSTDFLEPPVLNRLKAIADKERDILFKVSGGYEGAERQVFVLYPDFMPENEVEVPVGAIEITAGNAQDKIGHRDVLGAIVGLGIKREKIGDILIGSSCQVIVKSDILNFLEYNLTRVGKVNVRTIGIDLKQVISPERKLKEIPAVVASLRLDSVASAAFSVSRTKMQDYIKSGLVKVNWEEALNPSQSLKEGDVISFKGHGRAVFDSIMGFTKKDRISILLKKYI
ncbi:YlmH family RNA-binding protein [Caldanaerobius polysaccharolyticus]|uniref:YlmH family RNA-binding protein n=1 Tax=Caldanaerobius polysaccharolyticus TaxID=44256 RepID=UPI000479E799|nr:YlmH/Sll1252 family protein [Caldanaerobius polysaccharolyticus]